jgi:hypothetical protein
MFKGVETQQDSHDSPLRQDRPRNAGGKLEDAIQILEKAIDANRLPGVKNRTVAPWAKDAAKGRAVSHFKWMGLFWTIELQCCPEDLLKSKVELAWAIQSKVWTTRVFSLKDLTSQSFTAFLASVKDGIPELLIDYALRTSVGP